MKFEEKMNVDEAIRYLTRADITVGREIKTKTAVAIEMAIKALEELQAHREAWMKVISAVDQHTGIHSDGELYIKNFDVKKIIAEYRPKEGDTE